MSRAVVYQQGGRGTERKKEGSAKERVDRFSTCGGGAKIEKEILEEEERNLRGVWGKWELMNGTFSTGVLEGKGK